MDAFQLIALERPLHLHLLLGKGWFSAELPGGLISLRSIYKLGEGCICGGLNLAEP